MKLGMLNLLSFSPTPSTHAFSPNIKNGTSAPRPRPSVINSFFVRFILANLLIPMSIVVAKCKVVGHGEVCGKVLRGCLQIMETDNSDRKMVSVETLCTKRVP